MKTRLSQTPPLTTISEYLTPEECRQASAVLATRKGKRLAKMFAAAASGEKTSFTYFQVVEAYLTMDDVARHFSIRIYERMDSFNRMQEADFRDGKPIQRIRDDATLARFSSKQASIRIIATHLAEALETLEAATAHQVSLPVTATLCNSRRLLANA